MSPRSVVIVGGGASGILLAAQLLRQATAPLTVTLVEKRAVGRGLAYSADRDDLILNVPAGNMSAFVDLPGHFRDWLSRTYPELPTEPYYFAPRRYYGDYLRAVLAEAAVAAGPGRLEIRSGEVASVRETAAGAEVALADGSLLLGEVAVLAVGHEEQPSRGRGLAVRADSDADTPLPPDAPVVILGSGLSMVDAWLSLMARRHRGPVTILSRHGLLPLAHQPGPVRPIEAADVPLGAPTGEFMAWLRGRADAEAAAGGDWRAVVDGLRPYNQRIWQSWTPAARRQFLEHARPFWNVHRHRLPPALHARLVAAIEAGQVCLVPGRFRDVEALAEGVRVSFRRRGASADESVDVARVYDCGGVVLDVETSSNPTIRALLASGDGRPDAQRIGLDVTDLLNVVRRDGTPLARLFAVGPLTRGKFFEIEAIPDIRRQCSDLAGRLLEHLGATPNQKGVP